MYRWRPATPADVPQIAHVSSIALAGYPEEEAIFAELLRVCPAGCHVLEIEGEIAGYLVGHPWRRFEPPALNTLIGAVPEGADCWYIHDLSLLPAARGFGAAREAVAIAADCARDAGLSAISLVAVNGAAGFWQAQGFAARMDGMADRIASYGEDAIYMERAL